MNVAPLLVARGALAGLGVWTAVRRRPGLAPVPVALTILFAVDVMLAFELPAPLVRALWLLWQGVSAGLSWAVWRGSVRVTLLWAVTACTGGLWLEGELFESAFWIALHAGPAVSLIAWATRQRNAHRVARRVAALLAWSNFLDVAVGGLAVPDLPRWLSRASSAATMGILTIMLSLALLQRDTRDTDQPALL